MKLYHQTTQKISEVVTKEYSTSFYKASKLFKATTREAIFAIYGFVRFADEIVDTFHKFNQEDLLNKFETDFKNDLKTGLSLNPVLHSFILVLRRYSIDIELVDAFMNSMRQDLTIYKYKTQEKINEYIYGSAEVVGLMCLKVFCEGNLQKYQKLEMQAKKLGAAFQKVNFLRDLNEDIYNLNRTYFHQIENGKFDDNTKKQITEDIHNDFLVAYKGIKNLPKESRTAVYIAFLYYKKLLKKIEKTPADIIINKRIRVPNFIKIIVSVKGIVISKLNLMKN